MALRLRRGTNAERLTIIPQEGELVYTTDTKELYAGDGTTVGGNRITGTTEDSPAALTRDLDLDSNNITGTGNININGTVTASFDGDLIGDVLGDVQGSVFSQGSTLLVDALDGIIPAENIRGEFTGNVVGDVKGSIFGDDSALIIDGINNTLTINKILVPGSLNFENETPGDSSNIDIISIDQTSNIKLTYSSGSDISTLPNSVGAITFHRDDLVNGNVQTGYIAGGNYAIYIGAERLGNPLEVNTLTWTSDGKLGIGKYQPTVELDVVGNAKVSGFVQFGSLTTTERNTLTPAAGMVIWNSTTTQFEGFDGTNWINLVDGATSA